MLPPPRLAHNSPQIGNVAFRNLLWEGSKREVRSFFNPGTDSQNDFTFFAAFRRARSPRTPSSLPSASYASAVSKNERSRNFFSNLFLLNGISFSSLCTFIYIGVFRQPIPSGKRVIHGCRRLLRVTTTAELALAIIALRILLGIKKTLFYRLNYWHLIGN